MLQIIAYPSTEKQDKILNEEPRKKIHCTLSDETLF